MIYSKTSNQLVVGYDNFEILTYDEGLAETSRSTGVPLVPSLVAWNDLTGTPLVIQGSEFGATASLLDLKTGSVVARQDVDNVVNAVRYSAQNNVFYVLRSSMGSGVWRGATIHVLDGETLEEVASKEVVGFSRKASDMIVDEATNTIVVSVSGKYSTDNILLRYDLANNWGVNAIRFESSEGFPPGRIGIDGRTGRLIVAMGTHGNRVIEPSLDGDRPVPYYNHVIPGVYPMWFGNSYDGSLYGVAKLGESQNALSIVSFDLAGLSANALVSIDPGYSLFAMSDSGKSLYAANLQAGVVTRFCFD